MARTYHLTSALMALFLSLPAAADTVLPAWLIRIPDSTPSVFVAETARSQLHRYDQVDGRLERAASYYMSIGQKGIGKQRRGDQKTPIGTYFVTEHLDTTRMHEKYGPAAYPLDYPNAWDQRMARTGDGIWVHGTDGRGGRRPVLDTDGCISLPNDDLVSLADYFESIGVPVLIAATVDELSREEIGKLSAEIEREIETWVDALVSGDMHAYLTLFDPDFERWGMNREEWASFSLQTVGKRAINSVTVDELMILGYPGEPNLYLSRFRETLIEGERRRETMKRIYWRRDQHGALKIVAEDNG